MDTGEFDESLSLESFLPGIIYDSFQIRKEGEDYYNDAIFK